MAALITDLIDTLVLQTTSFMLDWGQETSGERSGRIRAYGLRPALWKAVFESAEMFHAEALKVQARINRLQGQIYTFDAYNKIADYPKADKTGSILGSATVLGADFQATTLDLSGLPIGYVLTEGDFISWDYGSAPTRALHQVAVTRTANASGNIGNMIVMPPIRPGSVDGTTIRLKKPSCEMQIVKDSFEISSTGFLSTVRFQGVQVIW